MGLQLKHSVVFAFVKVLCNLVRVGFFLLKRLLQDAVESEVRFRTVLVEDLEVDLAQALIRQLGTAVLDGLKKAGPSASTVLSGREQCSSYSATNDISRRLPQSRPSYLLGDSYWPAIARRSA